jgi:hypothetical protein
MDSAKVRREYVNPKVKSSFSGAVNVIRSQKQKLRRDSVINELSGIPAYTLHKHARRHYPRRRVYIPGIKNQYVADLVDISRYSRQNNNHKYLLTCMDGFSKQADVIPIKNKSASVVGTALEKILKKRGAPKYLQVDRGKEWLNQTVQNLLDKYNIKMFHTGSELKAVLIERFHSTLMRRLARYMTHNNTKRFVNVLPDIVSGYNNSYHRSIGCKPNEVSKDNELEVYLRLYSKPQPKPKKLYKPGDKVLISKYKINPFEKGYAQAWKQEVFEIAKVHETNPTTYTLRDNSGTNLFGVFYNQELQKVSHS